ncbi:RNA exonuclease 4 [Strongyloides ratti]|uniref:RNA exonuclease 4 n=1 Tax=Strongyloides ratti TaxID=34506 RepID=A0A090LBA0_STRRB|nr:RNA exonuclease 4 [Strongyloides ratti]CEF65403.1 RNA exonuclease 4 [Strongyloides ratti]
MSNWEVLQKKLAEEKKENPSTSIFSNTTKKKKKIQNGINNLSKIVKKKERKSFEDQKVTIPNITSLNDINMSNEGGIALPSEVTQKIGLDCEFVGVGHLGSEDLLARVSIVNYLGKTIYDKYIKPEVPIVDYRTKFSGIKPSSLTMGIDFSTVQKEVQAFIMNRIVIGHSLTSDFGVLKLKHPKHLIRDTSKFKGFLDCLPSFGNSRRTPSLKLLAQHILNLKIQEGSHDSALDAYYALEIYKTKEKEFDRWVSANIKKKKSK